MTPNENREAFRRWRASVVRLAQWDRSKMEHQAALRRMVERAIASAQGPCDCPTCLARIVQQDVEQNWPKILQAQGMI